LVKLKALQFKANSLNNNQSTWVASKVKAVTTIYGIKTKDTTMVLKEVIKYIQVLKRVLSLT
jgi:hypothetical protein